jgi:hypothetical protein
MTEIPAFLERMKVLTEDYMALFKQREMLSRRLSDAYVYFETDLTDNERVNALKLFNTLIKQVSELDNKLKENQTEYCYLLEAKASNHLFKFKSKAMKNHAGSEIPSRDFYLSAWNEVLIETGEDAVVISPDDLWALRIFKKTFPKIDTETIEKITHGGVDKKI